MSKKVLKCQCDKESKLTKSYKHLYTKEELKYVAHKPNKCKNTKGLELYIRNDKELFLCELCSLVSDTLVKGN